jgi:hypothetical protein
MKSRHTTLAVCAILALVAMAEPAAANDAVKASVTIPAGQPAPILIKSNGTGLTPGTYAIGTIQLYYTIQAFEFPVGPFATFNLGMAIAQGKSNPATLYAVPLTLRQAGSEITLTPAMSAFSVTSAAWTGSTLVTISIPTGVSNADGTELTGNLQIEAPGSNHLDTVTTIQVHITLVHPTACIKLYNFITDKEFIPLAAPIEVNTRKKDNTVTATNPGQFSDNVLVVNTCSAPQTFDVQVSLDPWFGTNPSGNPGNAVFAFSTEGELDPATFNIAAFGTGTPKGQSLSLTNVTVAGGGMFLLTVHMGIKTGVWNGGTAGTFSGFSAGLYFPDGTFTTMLGGVEITNPACVSLDYTVK